MSSIPLKNIVDIAEAFYIAQVNGKPGISWPVKHDISGLEPLMWKDGQYEIHDLIFALHDRGVDEVCLTTNAFLLEDYVEKFKGPARPEKIRASYHSNDDKVFEKVTGRNARVKVLKGILKAKDAGMNVALNRLIDDRNLCYDMPGYLNLAEEKRLRVKIFPPHYTTDGFISFERQDEMMQHVVDTYIKPRVVGKVFVDKSNPMSPRHVYPLLNGARVEIKLPGEETINKFPYCCECDSYCMCCRSTSLLPTAVRLYPNNRLIFCSVKGSPFIDLNNVLRKHPSVKDLADYISRELDNFGILHKNFMLYLRATVTTSCMFACPACHREGYEKAENKYSQIYN